MINIDYPQISGRKNTDQNLASFKAWANQLSDQLGYQLGQMQEQLDALTKEIEALKGDNK